MPESAGLVRCTSGQLGALLVDRPCCSPASVVAAVSDFVDTAAAAAVAASSVGSCSSQLLPWYSACLVPCLVRRSPAQTLVLPLSSAKSFVAVVWETYAVAKKPATFERPCSAVLG